MPEHTRDEDDGWPDDGAPYPFDPSDAFDGPTLGDAA